MKNYMVKMTTQFKESASKPIRTKKQLVKLMLEAISLLTNGEIIERPINDYINLRIDKMKRLFIVTEDKIFSFNFPFNVETDISNKNLVIFEPVTELELNAYNLSVLKATFESTFYDDEDKGILDLDSEILQILDSFDTMPNKDYIWQILKTLLSFEAGYLRYDYDEKRENGKLHPLNHLDINYSSETTFKIGMNNKIDCNILIDILDINVDSYYISK